MMSARGLDHKKPPGLFHRYMREEGFMDANWGHGQPTSIKQKKNRLAEP